MGFKAFILDEISHLLDSFLFYIFLLVIAFWLLKDKIVDRMKKSIAKDKNQTQMNDTEEEAEQTDDTDEEVVKMLRSLPEHALSHQQEKQNSMDDPELHKSAVQTLELRKTSVSLHVLRTQTVHLQARGLTEKDCAQQRRANAKTILPSGNEESIEDSDEAHNDDVTSPVTDTSEHSSSIIQEIAARYKTDGLIATRKYLLAHVDKWKRAKVKIAIAGQSTAGKSSFINFIRGVRFSDKGYAKEGGGNTTQFVKQYEHPKNKQLIYCDLPGYGTTAITREVFLERVNIKEYDMFLIFFSGAPSTDDKWLVTQLREVNIPFCFVRTKFDQDVESGKRNGKSKETVFADIKGVISDAEDSMPELKDATRFIVSNHKPSIGQMPQLIAFMQEKVIKVKFEAILFSIPAFTKEIIDKKYIQMAKRIQSVSLYHAFGYLSFDYKCSKIRDEIRMYFKVFELDGASATELAIKHHYSEPYIIELINSFKSKMPRIVKEIVPIYSVIQKYKVCSQYLHNLLDELKVDAYALYMHETQNIQN